VPRDPALKPYRLFVYSVYGLICCVLFVQLIRSVVGDLYGRRGPNAAQQSGPACLEDVQRLYDQLSARAVQPAPRGLEAGQLADEWDAWVRRWENEVARVSQACRLDVPQSPAMRSLAEALDGIEDLRRQLSRSGDDSAEDARRVKEALEAARQQLRMR
jgi:hypothetical protein